MTTKIWSKNNNLLSCKFLQNTHTYVCVYVCMYVEKKKFIIKLQILQTHICMCVCMYVCMYYVRIKVREEFIIYMLDNGARAFSIHPKKSKNRLYIHPSLHGNAERTELSITWVHPSRVCALESFRVVCWDDFGVKGFSFLFFKKKTLKQQFLHDILQGVPKTSHFSWPTCLEFCRFAHVIFNGYRFPFLKKYITSQIKVSNTRGPCHDICIIYVPYLNKITL